MEYSIAPRVAQIRDHVRDRRIALADGAIDAQYLLALLIENAIDGDSRFPGLAIAKNQLPLSAPDRNQRVNRLGAGGERHADRRAIHDRRSVGLDGHPQNGTDWPRIVERARQRINHPAEQRIAHQRVQHAIGPPHFGARFQPFRAIEQDHADVFRIQIEGHAEAVAVESD